MMCKCSIGVLPSPVSLPFHYNLSTLLLVEVKLLIELSLTVVHIIRIIFLKMFTQDVSYACLKNQSLDLIFNE